MSDDLRSRAAAARARAERLLAPTARETAMAQSFPLGVGFGRGRNREKRMDASIARVVRGFREQRRAAELEARAEGLESGTYTAQGIRITQGLLDRRAKREASQERRKRLQEEARAACEGKQRWQVDAKTWAAYCGVFGGPSLALFEEEHAEAVREARERGDLS